MKNINTKYLHEMRRKRQRIRTIFLHYKKLESLEGVADIPLLNIVVEELIKAKLPYSKNEIYSAFKEVNKDDYELKDKQMILKNLLRKGQNKSVFEKQDNHGDDLDT